MIDCKHFEYIDNTFWHSDVFDHPSYQSFCHLNNKQIYRHWCSRCENYVPDYEKLSDDDIQYELRLIQEKLEVDDRAKPMSGNLVNKLLERRRYLLEEIAKRKQ